MIAWFYWDPPRDIFTVPIIDRPIAWYGFFFVLGFAIGYYLTYQIFKKKLEEEYPKEQAADLSLKLTDRLTWFVMGGTIVGARLGHVFFYEWPKYKDHPIDIIKIWEGGLASHGGAIGILISLILFLWFTKHLYPKLNFLSLLDVLAIPTALACALIRIGNFFNQEILGPPTTVPWAIVFGHPIDGSAPVPRHPTQLYEALAYFAVFIILFFLWKKKGNSLRQGVLGGLFFILMCSARFLIEFVKSPFQSHMIDESFLQTGQYLSIPLIILGFIIYFWSKFPRKLIKS